MKILTILLLAGILGGEYNAKTLSKTLKDSLLNGTNSVECKEVGYKRGEWGSEVKTRKISPNGQYEAYIQGNNLYVHKKLFGTDLAVTHHEDSLVLNGAADWLYNEEFGCGAMFEWSPDSKMLAFVRLNTNEVTPFEWQTMLDVEEESGRIKYPQTKTIRYPRVGTANPKAEVCVYDVQYKDIRVMDIGEYEYTPRMRWKQETGNEKQEARNWLYVETLNRDQNKMQIIEINPKSGVSKVWYHEECADGWIDYKNIDEWQWLSNGNVIVVSDRSGWRQAYLYAANGKKINQLTRDGKDVTKVYGFDEKNKTLYYQIANTPMTRQNIRLQITGDKQQPTPMDDGKGWCELNFNKDYTKYIEDYQTSAQPNHYTLYQMKGGKWKTCKGIKEIEQVNKKNETILNKWNADCGLKKKFFSFVTERSDTLYGWTLTPAASNLSPAASNLSPAVLMHYSGPGSQRVVQKWKKKFEYVLAQEGYVVVCVDVRGTGARGQKWLHETYMNIGKKEAEDLISTAHWLCNDGLKKDGVTVDPERIAIGGWSYGGFQTIRTMSEQGSIFKCGFAIAPVTDFRFYDSGYTERFMRRVQVNENGYLKASLPEMADKLQGRLLLVHGLADDNVHCQNTWAYVDALIRAGKMFDMQVYPDDNHYLRERANYEHLHRKLLEFLNKELTTNN